MNLDMEIFQIMPNHIHGILVIGNNEYNSRRDAMLGVSNLENHEIDFLNSIDFPNTINCDRKIRDTRHCVSTGNTKMIELNPPANHFGPQSKNLASIVRGFKSAVTVASKLIGPVFGWQTRFHDHVIREDDEFRRIAYYIEQNPANWKDDMYK
jgi:REP element-mobilizing transposase RayT